MVTFVRGIVPVAPAEDDQKVAEAARRVAEEIQTLPFYSSLAAHVRKCWEEARDHRRRSGVDDRLLRSLYQRQGRYMPEDEAELKKIGAPLVYMMLTATKCRTAAGWLREVFVTSGSEKPWSIRPTTEPEMDEAAFRQVVQESVREAVDIENAMQAPVDEELMRRIVERVRDRASINLRKDAEAKVRRMERRMADQLEEGNFYVALDQFIEDLVTFPAAFMKGPVVRRRRKLSWVTGEDGVPRLQPSERLVLEWERVSPFDIYPAPWSSDIDDGYLIERMRLGPEQLEQLIGVEGFSDDAIRAVLSEASGEGLSRLSSWSWPDQERAEAEDKDENRQRSALIDVVRFWGPVKGSVLREWGLEEGVEDPDRFYEIECWLVDRWVVKAMLNPDPLGRRPYYKASYEEVPGSFWGHGVPELIKDCQQVCNAAARSLVMNMSLSSGPQVVVNTSSLPEGENPTQIFPWKIWITKTDRLDPGNTRNPVTFFQPDSNAAQLMAVYEKYSQLADEYSGLPRYMAGDTRVGGAGRTASGLSMLMQQANRGLRQVASAIDIKVLQPLLERLYFYNVNHMQDPAMTGDVEIIAEGSRMLMVKETLQVRRLEFLQLVLSSPVVLNMVGEEGLAALLREQAKGLDMDVDKLVPPDAVLRAKAMQQALIAQQAAQGQAGLQPQGVSIGSGQDLVGGAPVAADLFQPVEGGVGGQ